MNSIQNHNLNTNISSLSIKHNDNKNDSFIIGAHNSNNMKVTPPKVSAVDITNVINENKRYSIKEANARAEQINNDIYESVEKERSNHEFNFKRYFTIFGIIGLLTAAIAHFGKGK